MQPSGTPDTTSARPAQSIGARMLGLERIIYSSIGRAIRRRPAVADGATGFAYHSALMTVLIFFIVLSAVELVAIDFVVSRWPVVRVILLVLGIWGLIWMVGLLCAHIMRPHSVGPRGIQLRDGMDLDVALEWDDIEEVTRRTRVHPDKCPKIAEVAGETALVVAVSDRTNIDIALEAAAAVFIPGRAPKGGEHHVVRVCLWTDDSEGFLEAVRTHIDGSD